jgi:hypothetical protein
MDKLWINKNAGMKPLVSEEEIKLPEGYKWVTYTDDKENIKLIREFINKEFEGIKYTDEHILYYFRGGAIFKGIVGETGILGLISVKFSRMIIPNESQECVSQMEKLVSEINFLSITKPFRGKGFINLLVKEVIRISVNKGVKRGIYTSTDRHTNIIKECHYYHYLSNIRKLVEIGFIEDGKTIEIEKLEKILKVNSGVYKINRLYELSDEIIDKLNKYVKKFDISKKYENKENKEGSEILTDKLFEYYTIEDNGNIKALLVLYKLDYAYESGDIKNAIIYTYYHDSDIKLNDFLKSCFNEIKHFDCISCLDIMDITVDMLNELRMKEGSEVNYYMFDLTNSGLSSIKKIGNSNF